MLVVVVVPRRRLLALLAVVCLFGLWSLNASENDSMETMRIADAVSGRRVVIDAGHGGIDPGAVGKAGTREADVVLSVAKRLQALLNRAGVYVIMTREDDSDLAGAVGSSPVVRKRCDLEERVRTSTRAHPDLTVSIHANSFPEPVWSGAQTFYKPGCAEGMRLATAIQDSLVQYLGPNTRRAKCADLYILKRMDPPVALVEIGFLSNPREESLLRTDEYQQRAAEAIFTGIVDYLVDLDLRKRSQDGSGIGEQDQALNAVHGGPLLTSPDLLQTESAQPERVPSQTEGAFTRTCIVYFAGPTNFQDCLVPEVRTVSFESGDVSVSDLAGAALRELIRGPGEKSIRAQVIPSSTEVRRITVAGGLATVDLDAEFVEAYWGGSRSEELTVYSIVNTLTEIEGIDRVRLMLDGRSDVSIAGHIVLDQTFTRESRLIEGGGL